MFLRRVRPSGPTATEGNGEFAWGVPEKSERVMKRVFLGILTAAAVLVVVIYFVANSGPSYDTHPRRTFQARDSSVAGIIQQACFSEDGTRLVTQLSSVAPGQSGTTVFLWDLVEEKSICKLNPELYSIQVAISPDNQHFALHGVSGVTPRVIIHEAATGDDP